MKKKLLIALFLSLLSFNKISYAKSDLVQVILNGKKIISEVSPQIINNRTFLPIRNIAEQLGAKINWDSKKNSVTINYENNKIVFYINQNTATVNENPITLDIAPFILEGRTMVPLRFIGTNFDMNVEWIENLKTATITEKNFFDNLPKDIIMGFTVSYYNGDNLSYNSVKNNKALNMISVFNYNFTIDGKIQLVDQNQQNTIDYAKCNNIVPLAVIHNISNGNFNQELLHNVLVNPQKRSTLINNILMMLTEEGFLGVNIDFENIQRTDKDLYSEFIQELKDTLTKYGYITTISVPAKTSSSYTSSWNYAFDYEKLGSIVDYFIIMAYDEHYVSSNAGPIASINWVKNILDYSTKLVPSEKIILGLALYGYDWSNNKGQAIASKNVYNIASKNNASIEWDNLSKTPHFSYVKDGVYHELWYENEQSLKLKINLSSNYNLGGIGFWRLGLEEKEFLNNL